MPAEQKEPWNRLGKQEGEVYAKAKALLDKMHAKVSKTAAITLGPKQRAAVEAKTAAKAAAVTKTKVNRRGYDAIRTSPGFTSNATHTTKYVTNAVNTNTIQYNMIFFYNSRRQTAAKVT